MSALQKDTAKHQTSWVDEQDDRQNEVESLDELADAQRIFLEDWFAGHALHGEDSDRARELILEEVTGGGIYSWSPPSEFG